MEACVNAIVASALDTISAGTEPLHQMLRSSDAAIQKIEPVLVLSHVFPEVKQLRTAERTIGIGRATTSRNHC